MHRWFGREAGFCNLGEQQRPCTTGNGDLRALGMIFFLDPRTMKPCMRKVVVWRVVVVVAISGGGGA